MTMAEFADFYRSNKRYTEPECALWKDILYGSDKQLFWYADPYMRACVNMDQGGAIVDLRPYAAKLRWEVGIGTKHVQDASIRSSFRKNIVQDTLLIMQEKEQSEVQKYVIMERK